MKSIKAIVASVALFSVVLGNANLLGMQLDLDVIAQEPEGAEESLFWTPSKTVPAGSSLAEIAQADELFQLKAAFLVAEEKYIRHVDAVAKKVIPQCQEMVAIMQNGDYKLCTALIGQWPHRRALFERAMKKEEACLWEAVCVAWKAWNLTAQRREGHLKVDFVLQGEATLFAKKLSLDNINGFFEHDLLPTYAQLMGILAPCSAVAELLCAAANVQPDVAEKLLERVNVLQTTLAERYTEIDPLVDLYKELLQTKQNLKTVSEALSQLQSKEKLKKKGAVFKASLKSAAPGPELVIKLKQANTDWAARCAELHSRLEGHDLPALQKERGVLGQCMQCLAAAENDIKEKLPLGDDTSGAASSSDDFFPAGQSFIPVTLADKAPEFSTNSQPDFGKPSAMRRSSSAVQLSSPSNVFVDSSPLGTPFCSPDASATFSPIQSTLLHGSPSEEDLPQYGKHVETVMAFLDWINQFPANATLQQRRDFWFGHDGEEVYRQFLKGVEPTLTEKRELAQTTEPLAAIKGLEVQLQSCRTQQRLLEEIKILRGIAQRLDSHDTFYDSVQQRLAGARAKLMPQCLTLDEKLMNYAAAINALFASGDGGLHRVVARAVQLTQDQAGYVLNLEALVNQFFKQRLLQFDVEHGTNGAFARFIQTVLSARKKAEQARAAAEER